MIYVDILGDLLKRGRQMAVGSSKMAIFTSFARYIFRTFTFMATIIILYLVALHWRRNGWPIDLEWSFCVKVWSELSIQWVGVLAFGENCLEICRATHILLVATKKISPARYCTGDISVMGLFIGVIRRGSVKPVNCIHTRSSHTCRSLSLMSVEK